MISDMRGYLEEEQPHDLYGLSSDTKPTDVPNGSVFVEMDTTTIFVFDAENTYWRQWSS